MPRLISFNRKSFCSRGADEKFSILLLLAARLRHVIHARDVDDVNRMKHARSSFSLLHLSKNMFRDLRALHRAANGRKLRNTLRQDCHRFARRLCHKSLCYRLWCFAGMSWTSFSSGKFFSLTAFFWRSANNRRSIEIFMPCSCFRETTSREPYLCRLDLLEKSLRHTLAYANFLRKSFESETLFRNVKVIAMLSMLNRVWSKSCTCRQKAEVRQPRRIRDAWVYYS